MAIEFELADGVAIITINRPERLNAMDADAYAALSDAWTRVRDDDDVRVAIVTGAGDRAFTVGADLKSMQDARPTLRDHWLTQKGQLLNRGLEVWKPVIAAVNGFCLGGGMTLMLATDIRIAAEHATFSLAEVKRGLVAGNGGTQRVLRQLPYAIGMEMLLTGDSMDAETAARWGLVNRVVPKERLMDTAHDVAGRIAKNAPLALQASKELAIRAQYQDLGDGLRFEAATNLLLAASDDAGEGARAFAEKRDPEFQSR